MSTANSSSRMIHVDSGAYPLTINDIARRHPNVSMGSEVPVDFLNGLGYEVVARVQRPVGDVVEEGAPVLGENGWEQTYISRDFNEFELSAQLDSEKRLAKERLDQITRESLTQGQPVMVGDDIVHIQLRNDDRINLMYVHKKTEMMIAADQGEDEVNLRTGENTMVGLTASSANTVVWASLTAAEAIKQASWALEVAINNATTPAEVPDIPADFTPELI